MSLKRVVVNKARVLGRYQQDRLLDQIHVPNKINRSEIKPQKVGCVQEMTRMLNCLSANDFSETECAQEIANFKKCNDEFRLARRQFAENINNPTFRDRSGRPTVKQTNQLFKEWPNQLDPVLKQAYIRPIKA